MDYKELATAVKLCGNEPNAALCEKCPYWSGLDMSKCIPRMTADAATAITDLLARAEAAEARCKRLDEARERANEACAKWEYRAEKAERERDEAVKYIRHYGWCAGCKDFRGIKGCSGVGIKNCTEQDDHYEFCWKEK